MDIYKKYDLWSNVKEYEWTDWNWQYANCIEDVSVLSKILDLSKEEKERLEKATSIYRMKISPHLCLIMAENKEFAYTLKKQFLPSDEELLSNENMFEDVNADTCYMPVQGLVHRYPTKVLVFPSNKCGSFCRYCFRKKYVGECDSVLSTSQMDEAINYLREHKEINEVIFSGGDPLTLQDSNIMAWLSSLNTIESVKIVRFHTRMPISIPYRITDDLVSILMRFRHRFAIYFVLHIDTEIEISEETIEGLTKLIDIGIMCLASTPLLKGINDSEEKLGALWQKLVELRIKPYYLFQTDPVQGDLHFVVPIKKGIEIVRNLYDKISGLAMPLFCFNIPNGGGHVLLPPSSIKRISASKYEIINFEGKKYEYVDPAEDENDE